MQRRAHSKPETDGASGPSAPDASGSTDPNPVEDARRRPALSSREGGSLSREQFVQPVESDLGGQAQISHLAVGISAVVHLEYLGSHLSRDT